MSSHNRILNQRKLHPLNTNYRRETYEGAKFCNKNLRIKSIHDETYKTISDKPSKLSVTWYLLNNPDFVELFLIHNYSRKALYDILQKIPEDMTETFNHQSFVLKLENDQKSQVSTYGNFCQVQQDKHYWPIKSSFSLTDDHFYFPNHEQRLVINEDITHIKYNSKEFLYDNSVEENDWNNDKLLQLLNVPQWSLKLLHSHRKSELETCKIERKSYSKEEILRDINNDIHSVIQCDGNKIYFVDNVDNIIYLDYKTRPNSSNIMRGTTLVAHVASERKGVNTSNIFEDSRFPEEIFLKESFVKAVMAQPIILNNNELIGVIEVIRMDGKPPFSEEEEQKLNNYLSWGSITIFYNETYNYYQKQKKMNKFLMYVVKNMFGKFSNIDSIIKNIMASAKVLVHADRVTLFLVDSSKKYLFSRIFDIGNYKECIFEIMDNIIRVKIGEGIAGLVALTGHTLNINNAYEDKRFNRHVDLTTGYITKNLLCMPVKFNEEVIGVVQMLNKKEGFFTISDESEFETFAFYCGIALNIAKMYEQIIRTQQRYKVALDVLSYHSRYTEEEYVQLKAKSLPLKIDGIDKFSFWPWAVPEDNQTLYVMFMFKDLFDLELDNTRFTGELCSFDNETLIHFVLTVKRNYRHVPYHNWSHAFSVCHSMYVLIKTCDHGFNLYELLGLYIGSLCHDLDHRGKTNQYMVSSSSPLSNLYSTSTMEHHHFNITVTILQREGHNIFENLSPQKYKDVLGYLKHCILSTDLLKFFENKSKIELSEENLDPKLQLNKSLHMALMMTFSDLSAMFKEWEMQLTLVMIIMEEFWIQGDEERRNGVISNKLVDRRNKLELPECQVGFLQDVCLPCYRIVGKIFSEASCVIAIAESNLIRWKELATLPPYEKELRINELQLFIAEFIKKNKLNFK